MDYGSVPMVVKSYALLSAGFCRARKGLGCSYDTSYLLISAISSSICWSAAAAAGSSTALPLSTVLTANESREVTEGRRRKSIFKIALHAVADEGGIAAESRREEDAHLDTYCTVTWVVAAGTPTPPYSTTNAAPTLAMISGFWQPSGPC